MLRPMHAGAIVSVWLRHESERAVFGAVQVPRAELYATASDAGGAEKSTALGLQAVRSECPYPAVDALLWGIGMDELIEWC